MENSHCRRRDLGATCRALILLTIELSLVRSSARTLLGVTGKEDIFEAFILIGELLPEAR